MPQTKATTLNKANKTKIPQTEGRKQKQILQKDMEEEE